MISTLVKLFLSNDVERRSELENGEGAWETFSLDTDTPFNNRQKCLTWITSDSFTFEADIFDIHLTDLLLCC